MRTTICFFAAAIGGLVPAVFMACALHSGLAFFITGFVFTAIWFSALVNFYAASKLADTTKL